MKAKQDHYFTWPYWKTLQSHVALADELYCQKPKNFLSWLQDTNPELQRTVTPRPSQDLRYNTCRKFREGDYPADFLKDFVSILYKLLK